MARQRPTRHFGWVWPMWAGHPRIDRIVIRIVNNFVWVWPIWAGRPRIDRIVIRKVQYQLEVNLSRNEEVIVGRLKVGNGAMHIEIDRIVIKEVQYQFEVNRCRNEEVNFQGSSAYSVGGDSGKDVRTYRRTDGRRR
ncbi:hypothetical protein DPMN_127305 [Dreissena polymorpha]|uniref:Uncharacterized protein n=1 Tax=Dreissena polymorpha TaxID=45954 RepID=A0A9D4GYQ9_DREPO|nr:hypothetical protein DPMN_127305 [Dreissena polymorpha]